MSASSSKTEDDFDGSAITSHTGNNRNAINERQKTHVDLDGYGRSTWQPHSGSQLEDQNGHRGNDNKTDDHTQDDDSYPREHHNPIPLSERISHFSWAWFECTMSTGALATLLGQQPNTFPGLRTIGKVAFIIDLVLFLLFGALITARFIMKPGALSKSLHHPMESFYFGAFWVSIALILYATEQYGVASCGPWLVKALEICYWIYAACAILVSAFQYHVIFDCERLPVVQAMPAWILPVYPFLVLGPLAATLLYDQPRSAGLPILIGGICFQGLGWMIAFVMYTIYFTRLVNSSMPEEHKRMGMFVAVGPAAYTSTTFTSLGIQASKVLPATYLGLNGSYPVGYIWEAIGVPAGIFFWLFGFWNFLLASISVLFAVKKLHFDLTWWSLIFPQAGLTIAAIQLGNVLGSRAIQDVCSAATIVLVIAWLFVAGMTIRGVLKKQVLYPGMDEDEEDVEGHYNRADEEKAKQRQD